MGTAVHKVTKDVLLRGRPPDPQNWVINSPNLRDLIGIGTPSRPEIPKRHWVFAVQGNKDILREATPPEKAAADALELPALRTLQKLIVTEEASQFLSVRYPESLRLIFLELRGTATASYFTWAESVYQDASDKHRLIDAATTVAQVEAVRFSGAAFIATDPGLTLQGILPAAAPLSITRTRGNPQ